MIKLFTDNDLIRYVYGETSEEENQEIEESVVFNSDLEDELLNLSNMRDMVDNMFFQPSDKATKELLNYSLEYSVNRKVN